MKGARSLQGLRIVITGASSGIGRATALQAARQGAALALLARSEDALRELAEEIGREGGFAVPLPCDLSDAERVDALPDEIEKALGGIDVLVHSAGVSTRRELADSFDRFDEVERLADVNYFGGVRLLHAVLPMMLDQEDGHVVNISTGAVLTPIPRFSAYAASKAAMTFFLESAAIELRTRGIDVSTLYFPFVDTPMARPSDSFNRTALKSDTAAAASVLRAIRKRPHKLTYGLWALEWFRAIAPALHRNYLALIFASYASSILPTPRNGVRPWMIRRVWRKSPF